MKKILAIILAIVTCFSFAACGGGDKYELTGDWQVIAYQDTKRAASIGDRDDNRFGELVKIEDNNLSYTFDGKLESKETYFTAEDKQAVYEWKVYDTTYKVYNNSFKPFGESVMLWNGPTSSGVSNVLLRRNVYKEKFDPISSIISGEGDNIEISLESLVGDYSSCLVALNSGMNNCLAFSVKENENALTVNNDGGTINFKEQSKTWTVEDASLNPYLMGVMLKLKSGEEEMYITVLEVSETAICYALNSNGEADLKHSPSSVYNYGVLVKK